MLAAASVATVWMEKEEDEDKGYKSKGLLFPFSKPKWVVLEGENIFFLGNKEK